MIGIKFDKARAEYLLERFEHGLPIEVSANWHHDELYLLAGVCQFMVMSAGPEKWPKVKGEAGPEMFPQNVSDAIEMCTMLTMRVVDGEYDEQFEPVVRMGVFRKPDGTKCCHPLVGVKGELDFGEEDES